MATYTQIAALRRNQALKDKIYVALTKAAADVRAEDPATANHKARLRWASKVYPSPEVMCEQMMWDVLQNATIQTEGEAATDSDIQFVVNSLVNQFAD